MLEVVKDGLVNAALLEDLGGQPDTPERGSILRSLGVYTQRPAGDGFFMVRIRIPGGDLTSEQLEAIAQLSSDHGRGLADITVRQNIQLHWVRASSLPAIVSRLQAAGLSTIESGGGSVRNIVNCPVAGVDENELFDTSSLVERVNEFFAHDTSFSGLPRKLKVTISGCSLRCTYPEIHDIGLFAERDRKRNLIGFRARIGGGLSVNPRFSRDLGITATPDQVVNLCSAIATVFKDRADSAGHQDGRVKFQVDDSELPAFLSEVERHLGYRLNRALDALPRPMLDRDRSHLGIHGQKTPGLYYIGISILAGRTSADGLAALASLARSHAAGRLRTTNTQNMVLLDVPESNLESLTTELDRAGLEFDPSWSRKAIIACSGIQFCKQAIAETKARAADLSAYLENELELGQPIRISLTGCPNCCGQHHVCDVGLEGSSVTLNGIKEESFQVLLGGGVGVRETFARRLGIRIPAAELSESLKRLFTAYKALRSNGESFQAFCARHSDDDLITFLNSWDAPSLTGVPPHPTNRIACNS
ncbi:MAG TPA: nitrite/sulfite reductase [Blastocatellia bacterium]